MFFGCSPLSSADTLPHPQSHLPLSPTHFQQVHFKHSNPPQQTPFHFHRSPKAPYGSTYTGRSEIFREQRIGLPAAPIYHAQTTRGCSPGMQIHPRVCPHTTSPAYAPT